MDFFFFLFESVSVRSSGDGRVISNPNCAEIWKKEKTFTSII